MSSSTQSQNEMFSAAGWKLRHTYSTLPAELFRVVDPTPVREPRLVVLNRKVASELGLNAESLAAAPHVEVFVGNRIFPDSRPIAQAYAGHQFGGFTMLGDGRAILLCEHEAPSGTLVDVQLKGSGPTPYSRRGDGRAALGPMLREYIISHAMASLGISTTLSLAVARTGEPVYRRTTQPGAVLTRIAASHIRVGTFQYAAAIQKAEVLRKLADYSIGRHYPQLLESEHVYHEFLRVVIDRQAALVARWMHVGFIHGVMNTDNVSIAGETIDYGPCAFMNAYDPNTVFSSIDDYGRYAYANQPIICRWNLARLAETLLPLLADDQAQAIDLATEAVGDFATTFETYWLDGMRKKLGFCDSHDGDRRLIDSLLDWMHQNAMDYTNTFRDLTHSRLESPAYETSDFKTWHAAWRRRLEREGRSWADAQNIMQANNPAIIPRNHRVEEALAAAEEANDLEPMRHLVDALSLPYDERPSNDHYCQPPPGGDEGYCTFCGT